MIFSERNNLDALIEQNRSFAAYKLPDEDSYHLLIQEHGYPQQFHDYENLNNQKGFLIAPFAISEDLPIVLIKPDFVETIQIGEQHNIDQKQAKYKQADLVERNYNNYVSHFDRFIDPLKKGGFDKLVLSKPITIKPDYPFSPFKAFIHACKQYAHSFVHLCHTPYSGTWLGSTPETLLRKIKGEHWQTVSLAGTRKNDSNARQIDTWDPKNMLEQTIVTDYIAKQLSTIDLNYKINPPRTVDSGKIVHIETVIDFHMKSPKKIGALIKLIHPTPAVCGLPKEKAYQFITNNEGYRRSYYSGFVGNLNTNDGTNLYVNIRCMNIKGQDLTLYAGGGLLATSTVETEFEEWSDKLQTMLHLV